MREQKIFMIFSLSEKKNQVAVFAAVIYFIQGALGISAIAMPVYFRRLGWSIADITIVSSLISLPWIFKILYGFLSDSFPLASYRRKSYLFFFLTCSILGWCSLSFFGLDQKSIVFALWIANLGFAGTDVITDGLIVENSEGEWSRIYQSLAWGARSLGSVLTGMVGGWLMLKVEPQTIFLITASLPLIALPPLLILREERCLPGELRTLSWFSNMKVVCHFCLEKRTVFFVSFLCLSTSSVLFGTPFFFYLKEKLFFADDYLGFLISLGWAGAAMGSVLFALTLKKVSMKKMLQAVVIINTLNILSTYAVNGVVSAAVLIFLGGIAAGVMILPLMTAAAEMAARSGVEGTLFAVLMGLYNLSQIVWGVIGGKLLPWFGLEKLIALAALIQMIAYFLIFQLAEKNFQATLSPKTDSR